MSNLKDFAKREFEILRQNHPDSVVLGFENEIIKLIDKFGKSGQSGGSAPFYTSVIVKTIKSLLGYETITPITGQDSEWVWEDMINREDFDNVQNNRCFALFKRPDGTAYYLNAIVFQGEEDWNTFTSSGGGVYIDESLTQSIGSCLDIKGFPFVPKTFYIDVVKIPISSEDAESRGISYTDINGESYYTVLKDKTQLDEVFEYYQSV